jgi:hypothetical protein
MIIQTITLEGIFGRWRNWLTFQKFTDNNGNVIEYRFNGKDVTEAQIKATYKDYLKNGREMKRKITAEQLTIDKYIERLDKSIDKYYMYIDDGRQYEEAVAHNTAIGKKIEQYKALKEKGVE